MSDRCVGTGDGFLLVYGITSRVCFEDIRTYHQQILRPKGQDAFPMIVVANKCDRKTRAKSASRMRPAGPRASL